YGFCQKLIRRYRLAADMIIGNNGGSIWIRDEKVMEEQIEARDVIRIMEFLKDHVDEINPFVCNEKSTFFFMKEQYAPKHWDEVREQLSYLGDIAEQDLLRYLKEKQEPVVKISIHTYTQERRDIWLPILCAQ
ncbi:HAD hydrolase family protein, partial [Erysipelatoclostridium ramosum]